MWDLLVFGSVLVLVGVACWVVVARWRAAGRRLDALILECLRDIEEEERVRRLGERVKRDLEN